MADELGALIKEGPLPVRPGAHPPYGLLHGTSGIALLFLRLHTETEDPRYLDLADLAMRHDLARCRTLLDGTVVLSNGKDSLPYLHGGSCGLAFPVRAYLAQRAQAQCPDEDPDEEKAAVLAGLRETCDPIYVHNAGLLRGRCGAIAVLAALGKADDVPVIRRQVRRLSWHVQPHHGHLMFPGFRMLRLASDLATGSAGVLLALSSAFEGTDQILPYLDPRSV
jgi:hypothetical protein